jgi:hypothetical protein
MAAPTTEELEKQIQSLTSQVEKLKGSVKEHVAEEDPVHNHLSWLEIGGDLRVRHDALRGHSPSYTQFMPPATMVPMPAGTVTNASLLTTKLGLNLKALVAEGVTFKGRLAMNKAYGMAEGSAFAGTYFSDRYAGMGTFDGTVGKIPDSSQLVVEQAYFDWSNIGGQPVWFSAGRRPSTGGVPTHLRRNSDHEGVSGVMGLLTDYVFDGFSLGFAPDIKSLPGFATKLCAGRAFQTGFQPLNRHLKNTDMLGVVVLPVENDTTRIETQYQHAFNLMDTVPGPNVSTNLGDVENLGAGVLHKMGPWNVFAHGALSRTQPNGNTNMFGGGLLYTAGAQSDMSRQGWAVYTGLRYDIEKTGTKLGAEYNMGSKNWITFTPAADDVWTSKLGTRGNVYEAYVIQEIKRDPVAPKGKLFVRLGWQYYDFRHTGSNNWVGGPETIASLAMPQFLTPLKNATDVYTTVELHF